MLRRPQNHPAAAQFLVAQHRAVGDKAVVAQAQEFRHHALGGGNLGVAADFDAQNPQPHRRKHRGVKSVQLAQAAVQNHGHGALVPIAEAMNRRNSRNLARQHPPQAAGHQHGRGEKQRAGGNCQQKKEAKRDQRTGAGIKNIQRVCVQPVNQHERRKHRQEKQHGHRDGGDAKQNREQAAAGERNLRPRRQRFADLIRAPRRCAVPNFIVGNSPSGGQRRLAGQVRAFAQFRVVFQHGIGIHHRIFFQNHRPDDQLAIFHAGVFDVHERAEADAVLDRQQFRRGQRDGVNHHVPTDAGAERAQIQRHPWRAGEQIHIRQLRKLGGQPPAEINHAPQRISPGLEPARRQPPARDGDGEIGEPGEHKRRQRIQHR